MSGKRPVGSSPSQAPPPKRRRRPLQPLPIPRHPEGPAQEADISRLEMKGQLHRLALERDKEMARHRSEVESLVKRVKLQERQLKTEKELVRKHRMRNLELEDENQSLREKERQSVADGIPSNIVPPLNDSSTEALLENERLNKRLLLMQGEIATLKQGVKAEKERATRATQRAENMASQQKVYQDTAARLARTEFENQRLKARVSASEDNEKMLRTYRKEVQQMDLMRKRYLALQQEVRTLREQEIKTVKLESQVAQYQMREKEWENAIMEKERAAHEVTYIKRQNEAWLKAIHRFFPDITTPAMANQALTMLNKKQAALLHAKNEAVNGSQEAIRSLEQATMDNRKLTKEIAKLRDEKRTAESLLQAARVELVSVKRERDSVNEILNHYELEDVKKPMLSQGGAKDKSTASDIHDIESSPSLGRMKRIQHFETQLRHLEEENRQLRKFKISAEASKAEAEEAKLMLRRTESMLEKTEKEVAVLRSKLGRGEYDKATTKVVHLSMNPSSLALKSKKQKEQNALRNTIKTLEAKIVAYEEQIANNKPNSATHGVDALEVARKRAELLQEAQKKQIELRSKVERWMKEAERAKREAQEGSTRLERLRTVFRQKVSEFREACYCMTGYKIELMIGGDKYRLRPMYAGSENEDIIIQFHNGQLSVLETDFVRSLDSQTKALMTKFHSVPAFLSQITIDLFNQTTIAK
mmetsp:Transcript_20525/g.39576  ORF Transcript_20525/g.39576 Transcript_20525/m.39576 type:complete len:704 (-) Transcript_20525:124-2235(-)